MKQFSLPILTCLLLGSLTLEGNAETQVNLSKSKKALEVGVILRLKDTFSDTLTYTLAGIETARVLFEKTHPEYRVILKRYSHEDGLESVLEASKRAIQDHIPVVIGGELSEEAFVLRDQLGAKKIVFVTPTSSNPAVTEGHPYSFRVCFSDRWVAAELASFTVSTLRPKAIGLIHDVSSPYTDFQSIQYLATFKQLMAQRTPDQRVPVYEELILKDTVDFEAQIKSFMQNKISHVVLLLHRGEFVRFVAQANRAGFFPVYVGSEGWGSSEHINRDLFEGSEWRTKFVGYRSSFWNEKFQTSIAESFRSEYLAFTGRLPNSWGAVGFDSAWLLLAAMSRSSDPSNGEEIRKQLKMIRGMELVTQPRLTFGNDNSPHSSIPIFRIQGAGSPIEVLMR